MVILNIPKMFPFVHYIMSDLSWKFQENLFWSFAANRETKRKRDRQTDGKTDWQTSKDENMISAIGRGNESTIQLGIIIANSIITQYYIQHSNCKARTRARLNI